MTLAATTISDIVLNADAHDLDRILQALKDRRKTLSAARASAVQIGMAARTEGLSPKYLNNLTGVIERGAGRGNGRLALRLDEKSTETLRWAARAAMGRFYMTDEDKAYLLDGIPMQCFVPA